MWKQVKELTKTEDDIRWYLQNEYDDVQKYKGNDYLSAGYEGMMRLANCLVSPRRFVTRAGVMILVEEVE